MIDLADPLHRLWHECPRGASCAVFPDVPHDVCGQVETLKTTEPLEEIVGADAQRQDDEMWRAESHRLFLQGAS